MSESSRWSLTLLASSRLALLKTAASQTDNLIALKLGQEHAVLTHQDIILLKLDFEKAFDRVDHSFLWATLMAMNLDPFVLTLIQGLVMNMEAKVHVNGFFTPPFPLERGVRQGDPLATLLFVLSAQHRLHNPS